MESFSKFARNLNFNKPQREGQERMRPDRDLSERRRMIQNSVSAEQIKEVINDSNDAQLDAIQDMFYDERVDRESAGKELLRAVDSNAKLLNKNYRLLNDIKDDLDSDETVDLREISEENKEEILKAVFSNKEILTLLKQELIDNKAEENREWVEKLFDKETAEKAFIDLEDHVHKENVKCCKNVQAAIEETDEKAFGRIKKGFNAVKALVTVSLLFGIANLAFLICWYLRLI
ncbi:MAG: hypothetical protein K6E63_00955 [Lachnospiraceae bacterium]|nr:hypothetical protein [Lachnospiraceae bacterium]